MADLGLCVSVYDIKSVEGGFVLPGDGAATYKVYSNYFSFLTSLLFTDEHGFFFFIICPPNVKFSLSFLLQCTVVFLILPFISCDCR